MTNLNAKITARGEKLDERITNLGAKITTRDEKHAEEIKKIHKDLGEMKGMLDTLLRVMAKQNK